MSENTKLIVLKSKELIYTAIFVVLIISVICILCYMFSSKKDTSDKDSKSQLATETSAMTDAPTYKPGTYASNFKLNDAEITCTVCVNAHSVTEINLVNVPETILSMYPLLTPTLNEINSQLSFGTPLEQITYSNDTKYTTLLILEAARTAIAPAVSNDSSSVTLQ